MEKTKLKLHVTHTLLILSVLLLVGSILLGFLIQQVYLIKLFDNFFYEFIHHGPHFRFLDILITPFNYNFLPAYLSPLMMPSYYYFMFLFTLIYLFFSKRSLVLYALFAFIIGTIIAQLITALDWHFVFRPRPFMTLPNYVDSIGKSAWEKLSSYPSGHARETALYSTIIASFIPKLKWPLIIFVLFVGYSRIYIGAHYPTDVLIGIGIGFLTGKITLLLSRELQITIQGRQKGEKHDIKPV